MRLLIVTQSLPLPFFTAESRWTHLLVKELGALGWNVTGTSDFNGV
jgi:hypothetical protein